MKPSEFDFRLWINDEGIYCDVMVEAEEGGQMKLIPTNDDNVEIELWSGFKDCNGNNIYAGDIVKNLDTDLTYLVEFYNTHFILSPLKYQHRREFQLSLAIKFFIIAEYAINCEFDFLKILGNIHENPEI